MIFGLMGKFGIDIGKKIFPKIFFRNEKNLETFSKNIFSEKNRTILTFFENTYFFEKKITKIF